MQVRQGESPTLFLVESESEAGKWHQVFCNGITTKCSCKGFISHKTCKHLKPAQQEYLRQNEGGREPEEEEGMITPPPSNGISKWIKKIHGRDFVQYEGLLAMAHEQGLTELHAEFISVTETLALAFAWVSFKDGRKFWESGDATPNNVHSQVKAHFPRVALTRAKARALRDALNIGTVAVEELDEAV
jgi:hypothetical protein